MDVGYGIIEGTVTLFPDQKEAAGKNRNDRVESAQTQPEHKSEKPPHKSLHRKGAHNSKCCGERENDIHHQQKDSCLVVDPLSPVSGYETECNRRGREPKEQKENHP